MLQLFVQIKKFTEQLLLSYLVYTLLLGYILITMRPLF